MAVNQTLLDGAEEIRDASAVGENTALRVGTELVGIVQEIGDVDDDVAQNAQDISDLDDSKADLNTGTERLEYSQAPVVVLDSMGTTIDSIGSDTPVVYSPNQGDTIWATTTLRYYKVYIGPGEANVIVDLGVPDPGIVYVNRKTGRLYVWNTSTSSWDEVGIKVINDTTTGGEFDALSAEQGKNIHINVDIIRAKVDELLGQLAGIAFEGSPVDPIGNLDWNDPVPIVYHTVTIDTTGLDGAEIDGASSQQVTDGTSATINVVPSAGYAIKTVSYKIGADGAMQNATVTDGTAEITVNNVTADITVYLYSTKYIYQGVDENGDPVLWEYGYYKSNNNDVAITVNTADGAFSDFIPASFVVNDVLSFDMGAKYIGGTGLSKVPYIEFYDSNKEYIGHIGQSTKPRSWTIPSGNNALNTAYIRVSAYLPDIGSVYVKRNNDYLFKGDDL